MHDRLDYSSVDFVIDRFLARGSFGAVYKATNLKTGKLVAIKSIDLERSEDSFDSLPRESRILAKCRSPHICSCFGSFVKESNVWIVLELMAGGSARERRKKGPMDEMEIGSIVRDTVCALDYLDNSRIIHRDVKAENILFTDRDVVKLGDLGEAVELDVSSGKCTIMAGSPCWMAPEVVCGIPYDQKADVWSLGITAIELAQGKPPHSGLPVAEVLQLVRSNPPPRLHGQCTSSFKDFVSICLDPDPESRPQASDLMSHPFILAAELAITFSGLFGGEQGELKADISQQETSSTCTDWTFPSFIDSTDSEVTSSLESADVLPALFVPLLNELRVHESVIESSGIIAALTRTEEVVPGFCEQFALEMFLIWTGGGFGVNKERKSSNDPTVSNCLGL